MLGIMRAWGCMSDSRPLAVDLCSGLGGWADGLEAEGYDVIRVDIADMFAETGTPKPPNCLLMLQDIRTFHGSQAKNASLIVASPPCQAYSWMAMPWTKAKAKAAAIRADESGEALRQLNELFEACFRIQREACEAAGRHIPLVVENVRGAERWVGRSRWAYGSYLLWGDVPALMPPTSRATKVPGFRFDGSGGSFQTAAVNDHIKAPAKGWFNDSTDPNRMALMGSKSPARKAASANIAKIPTALSRWIGMVYYPQRPGAAG